VEERLDRVAGTAVRSLRAGAGGDGPHVVIVPGLGALAYLLPTVRALARRGVTCTLLDVPGFGSQHARPASGRLPSIAACVAAWVRSRPATERVVLLGHSTGAQSALLAALDAQDDRPVQGLVMAGPTVAPSQRGLSRLVAAAPAAYRRDSLRELAVVPDFVRAGRDLLVMLRSAVADRPEVNVAGLRAPLLVTAGRRDAFAPREWLAVLARSAVRAPSARVVVLPGSHNNVFTHPAAVADLVASFAGSRS
jgi:pimeloyl-ACP methyl ester carboxylesterase